MKTCPHCKIHKPLSDFGPDKRASDGKQSCCRKCSTSRRNARRKESGVSNQEHYQRYRDTYKRKAKAYRVNNTARYLLQQARARANRKGIDFSLSEDDILPLPEHCPVLGIPLRSGQFVRDPQSFTLDRVDNSKGYTPDNVRVISFRANTLKADASVDELRSLVRYMEDHT